MAAQTIVEGAGAAGVRVTVYDRMPSLGRKLLMAGRGGLNLTYNEPYERFVARYGEASEHLRAALDAFTPDMLRAWSESLGEPTFTGTSGRVFPKSFKASPLLRAWLRKLNAEGVEVRLRHRWQGWDAEGALLFDMPKGRVTETYHAVVLALGGASWPKLGSDGAWVDILAREMVAVSPLKPANAGFTVDWSSFIRDKHAGQPLKRVALSFGDQVVRGEAMVTRDGIEGGAVYALSSMLRDAIEAHGKAVLHIALRPDETLEAITQRLSAPRGKQSLSTFLRKALNLSPLDIALLNEAAVASGQKLAAMPSAEIAALVNALPVTLTGAAGLLRAISTAGGVRFDALDGGLMLRTKPGVFVAGEMLDWEAPTGGYLLQASLATGVAAGRGVLRWILAGN
jgi:uncharacterized flavoprotein (TIGR03862 family)